MASPRSTCSILMTSAPQSASSAEAAGTKVCSATSRIRTPCMIAVIGPSACRRAMTRMLDDHATHTSRADVSSQTHVTQAVGPTLT